MEELSKLPPIFKEGGTVTAGNSSGINDGASAVLILSRELVSKLELKRKWNIVSSAAVGVDPLYIGIGFIPVIKKVLRQTGYEIKDIELFELNGAFAASSIAVERELGLNHEIINVNRDGIVLDHPI